MSSSFAWRIAGWWAIFADRESRSPQWGLQHAGTQGRPMRESSSAHARSPWEQDGRRAIAQWDRKQPPTIVPGHPSSRPRHRPPRDPAAAVQPAAGALHPRRRGSGPSPIHGGLQSAAPPPSASPLRSFASARWWRARPFQHAVRPSAVASVPGSGGRMDGCPARHHRSRAAAAYLAAQAGTMGTEARSAPRADQLSEHPVSRLSETYWQHCARWTGNVVRNAAPVRGGP